jgi:sulfoxide reductase heme-binding subunit YedZ
VSHSYNSVGWNRQKKIYDLAMALGIAVYLSLFVGVGSVIHPNATVETLLIRGFGTCALFMLHVILSIGPLCRLAPRLLPLLYNRRHFGVTMFLMALAHGVFSLIQFHALGKLNPLVSVLVSNTRYDSFSNFPFQPLGLIGLGILFLMAATSHDFWLANLTAPVWKRLHMLVYVAYGLIVAHVVLGALQSETSPSLAFVVLGALQSETSPSLALALGLGMTFVLGLHLSAGWRERKLDEQLEAPSSANVFVDICGVEDIESDCAKIVTLAGERVAVFKYDGKVSALSNVCQHQNGPLGEGRIIDGCVTCPWHGYQYLPDSGASPPPFAEKVPTFNVKVVNGRVLVDPKPNVPGTRVEPANI